MAASPPPPVAEGSLGTPAQQEMPLVIVSFIYPVYRI